MGKYYNSEFKLKDVYLNSSLGYQSLTKINENLLPLYVTHLILFLHKFKFALNLSLKKE